MLCVFFLYNPDGRFVHPCLNGLFETTCALHLQSTICLCWSVQTCCIFTCLCITPCTYVIDWIFCCKPLFVLQVVEVKHRLWHTLPVNTDHQMFVAVFACFTQISLLKKKRSLPVVIPLNPSTQCRLDCIIYKDAFFHCNKGYSCM